MLLPVGSEEAETQSQVEGQTVGNAPVVLKVGLQNLIAVVVLDPSVLLSEARDVPEQQICERIPGGNIAVRGVESQIPRDRPGTEFTAQFIFLSCNRISSKLQIVPANNLADVVSECVSWVRVVSAVRNVAGIFPKTAAIRVADEVDARHDALAIAAEKVTNNHVGWPLPIAHVVEDDVIGGVAEHELIQQRGRKVRSQARD